MIDTSRRRRSRSSSPPSTEARTFQHSSKWGLLGPKAITGVAFSPDSRWLVTASEDATARIWDVDSGQQLQTFLHSTKVNGVAFFPDGRRLVTCGGGSATI